MSILARPIAGTLMGAVALAGAGSATAPIITPSDFEKNPNISASPANKQVLGAAPTGTDPFVNFGGPGAYIMRVPANVRGMRLRAWGGSPMEHQYSANNAPPPNGGHVQADFGVTPSERLLVIIGADGGSFSGANYPSSVLFDNKMAFGGAATLNRDTRGQVSGGFTGVFRPTPEQIAEFGMDLHAIDFMFERYFRRSDVPAILVDAKPMLVAAGAGGLNTGAPAQLGGRGGFAVGESPTGSIPGQGGTQFAGGAGGANTAPGQPGTKYAGGAAGSEFSGNGGGGYYGGGGGGFNNSSTYGPGGGGSNYLNQAWGFNGVLPVLGYTEEAEAPPISGTHVTNTYRRQGRLIALWDTPV